MTLTITRIYPQPVISGPGLSTSQFPLELPTLERLEAVFGRTNGVGPTLYGWMEQERAKFGVREGITFLDEALSRDTYCIASIQYNSGRISEDPTNLRDLSKTAFDKQGRLTPNGMAEFFEPLKECVAISANTHVKGKSTDYALVYSYSTNNGNPFFIYVGALDGVAHDYRKTLTIIAPDYNGILIASSAQELKQRPLTLGDFLDDFVQNLIPAIQAGLPRKIR
jgi:hypothetical protein